MTRRRLTDNWEGYVNPERHRTCGRRAWCECGEWCYPEPDLNCGCCQEHRRAEDPCPHCDGRGWVES